MQDSRDKLEEVSQRAEEHYAAVQARYRVQTRQLVEMKQDLEYIHRKIHGIKKEAHLS